MVLANNIDSEPLSNSQLTLQSLDEVNLIASDNSTPESIQGSAGNFECRVNAKVIQLDSPIVEALGVVIHLSLPLPKGIEVGDYVQFRTTQLSLSDS